MTLLYRDEQIDQNEFDLDFITDRYVLSSTIRAPIRPALITLPEAFTSKPSQFIEPKTTTTTTTTQPTVTLTPTTTVESITVQYNDRDFDTTTLVSETQPPTSSEAER